jgi:hypothetical protein
VVDSVLSDLKASVSHVTDQVKRARLSAIIGWIAAG